MTLIELLVVLTILAVIAGLIVAQVSNVSAWAPEVTTASSLQSLKTAIVGVPNSARPSGFQADMLAPPARVVELFVKPTAAATFDPQLGLGWRGPYLASATGSYLADPALGFDSLYGADGDPAALDGWSRPIVLQFPDPDGDGVLTQADREHARLISAGADGRLTTPITDAQAIPPGSAHFPARAQCADDVLLYLHAADLRPD